MIKNSIIKFQALIWFWSWLSDRHIGYLHPPPNLLTSSARLLDVFECIEFVVATEVVFLIKVSETGFFNVHIHKYYIYNKITSYI